MAILFTDLDEEKHRLEPLRLFRNELSICNKTQPPYKRCVHNTSRSRFNFNLKSHFSKDNSESPISDGLTKTPTNVNKGVVVHHPYNSYDLSQQKQIVTNVFDFLAKSNRTWRRLRHVIDQSLEFAVDNASLSDNSSNLTNCSNVCSDQSQQFGRSIVDIGCDHGILAIALAATGSYQTVMGLEVSERALQDGAINNQIRIMDFILKERASVNSGDSLRFGNNEIRNLSRNLQFRLSDGLQLVNHGEADAICLTGMGVITMIDILFCASTEHKGDVAEVERVGCKQIYAQPTNSRPRNLVKLYDSMAMAGFQPRDERIEYLSSRWYISVQFSKVSTSPCEVVLPGQILSQLPDQNSMSKIFMEYVQHHMNWLQCEGMKTQLSKEDRRWLDFVNCQLTLSP